MIGEQSGADATSGDRTESNATITDHLLTVIKLEEKNIETIVFPPQF